MSQDIFMFDGTIEDNIAYPNKEQDPDKIIVAAKQSQAHEFITKLPNGYKSLIGDRGQKLSAGQKQRIAIARAIYKNPPILVLMKQHQLLIMKRNYYYKKALNIISKNRTTIVIAHRLSTIRNANNIIVLGNNKFIEQGDHKQLVKNDSIYKKLWDIQTGQYDNK